jgi:hypothetical protein
MTQAYKALSQWPATEVAAEVARRLRWTDALRDQFCACGIDGIQLVVCSNEDLRLLFFGFPSDPARHAIGVLNDLQFADLSFGYHDHYLGRPMRFVFNQRSQIDAPLHVIAAAAVRLHLPCGHPLAHEQLRPPSGYSCIPLWPAQLQRAAIGFAAAASHGLATAPASVNVSARTAWRWRTLILLRVMCGYVARIEVRVRLRAAVAAAHCAHTRARFCSGLSFV